MKPSYRVRHPSPVTCTFERCLPTGRTLCEGIRAGAGRSIRIEQSGFTRRTGTSPYGLSLRDDFIDGCQESERPERLRDVAVCARCMSFVGTGVGRDDDDPDVVERRIGANRAAHGQSIEDGHRDIQQEDIGPLREEKMEGHFSISRLDHPVRAFEREAEQSPNPGFVIGHQHVSHSAQSQIITRKVRANSIAKYLTAINITHPEQRLYYASE